MEPTRVALCLRLQRGCGMRGCGDVADALRDAAPAVQPLMAGARDVDVFLVALVDQVVDRELRAGDPWGPMSLPGAASGS